MRHITLGALSILLLICVTGCQTQKTQAKIKTQQEKINQLEGLNSRTAAMLSDSEKQLSNCQQELQVANTKSAARISSLEQEIKNAKTENETLRKGLFIKQGVEEIKAMQRHAAEEFRKQHPTESNKP